MSKRTRRSKQERPVELERKPLEGHLIGTMFDTTRLVERVLSTGTVVRLRVERLGDNRVMVHEARRKRNGGVWSRWQEFEGLQFADRLGLETDGL